LSLAPNLTVIGFAEKAASLKSASLGNEDERDIDVPDEICNSDTIISVDEMFSGLSVDDSSIFVFNCLYMHSLNKFLFFGGADGPRSMLKLCIIPASLEAATRLPLKIGDVSFAVPKSLRNGGNYTVAELDRNVGGRWEVASIHHSNI